MAGPVTLAGDLSAYMADPIRISASVFGGFRSTLPCMQICTCRAIFLYCQLYEVSLVSTCHVFFVLITFCTSFRQLQAARQSHTIGRSMPGGFCEQRIFHIASFDPEHALFFSQSTSFLALRASTSLFFFSSF